jgi:hypothetical protein
VNLGLKIALPLFWLAALAVCSVMGTPWDNSHLSMSPNIATGQVIPLSVRGTGTVYLDANEWVKLAPYWYFYTISLWGGVILMVLSIGWKRIQFSRKKRKSERLVD